MGRGLHALNPRTRWLGRHREVLAETDSTNLQAEALAEAGARDGTVVLADRQTAGRGRLGRSFFSPGGVGLYLSAILRWPELPAEQAHRHVFAAAVAVAHTVRGVPELADRVEIKWPNDVLLDGRKTSGINLVSRLTAQGGLDWLVLGIGVNVNTAAADFPTELQTLATSLAAARGAPLDRTAVAEDLLLHLEHEIDELRGGHFDRVLERWRALFRMAGAHVEVGLGAPAAAAATGSVAATAPAPVAGDVIGIDEEGALLLDTPFGVHRIVAGDVTVLRRQV